MLHNSTSPYLSAHWWIYWPMVLFLWYNTFDHHHWHAPVFQLLSQTNISTKLFWWIAAYWLTWFHALSSVHVRNTDQLLAFRHLCLVHAICLEKRELELLNENLLSYFFHHLKSWNLEWNCEPVLHFGNGQHSTLAILNELRK